MNAGQVLLCLILYFDPLKPKVVLSKKIEINMLAHEKFKNSVFHLSLKHKNGLVAIFHIGEKVDTTKRLAIHRCAVVFNRSPSSLLLDELSQLGNYDPTGSRYSSDINGIKMVIERFTDKATFQDIQNPFKFALHSNPSQHITR